MEIKDDTGKLKLSKAERLCGKKQIDELFTSKQSLKDNKIKILWSTYQTENKNMVKVLFVVPKRNIKSAVDRNKIKRRLREAWRLNKHRLELEIIDFQLHIGLLYLGKTISEYHEIEKSIQWLIPKLNQHLKRHENDTHSAG